MKQPEQVQERPKTLADFIRNKETARYLGIAGRGVAKGVGTIPDLLALPYNVGQIATGGEPLDSFSEMAGQGYDYISNNKFQPQTLGERALETGAEFISGGGGIAKAGATAGSKFAQKFLAPKGVAQYTALGTAGTGLEVGKEIAPDSPLTQMGTAIAGGVLPGVGYKAATKLASPSGAMGKALGVNPSKVQSFEKAGLSPTLADVTDSKFIKGLQNSLSEAPITGGIINDALKSTRDKISKLDSAYYQEPAGQIAQEGIKAYITKANNLTAKLKQSWADDITSSEKMQINNASKLFSQKPTIYEPENIKAFEKSPIGQYYQKLDNIAKRNNGEIPVGDAMFIRDQIYDDISTFGSIGKASQGQLKRLAGSIAEDLRDFAHAKSLEVGRNFDRYNKFYTQYRTKLDEKLQPLLENKTATETFNSITKDLRVDAKKADVVLNTLKPEQKEIFSQSLIKELGMNPQNEFNGSYLATNFKKLEPQAQDVVLSGLPEKSREQFRAIIESIDHMKGTQAQGNPSGTFNQLFKLGILGAIAAKPITTSGAIGAGYGTAKLMTNPKFINWMSKGVMIQNEQQAAKHIRGLPKVAKGNPELAPIIDQYVKTLYDSDPEEIKLQMEAYDTKNLESLSDEELLKRFSRSDEIKNLTEQQLEELSNLYEAMKPVQ